MQTISDTPPSGCDTLTIRTGRSYDTITSDDEIKIDGIILLKEFLQLFGNIPCILFTGRGRGEVGIQIKKHGADCYRQKREGLSSLFVVRHLVQQEELRRKAAHSLIGSEPASRDLPDVTTDVDPLLTYVLTLLCTNEAYVQRVSKWQGRIAEGSLHGFDSPNPGNERIFRIDENGKNLSYDPWSPFIMRF
ncbi:MAG TPA: response regulator [Methanospirillum sp.]|nr:response regulator [Methanospirillum sp.]